MARIKRTVPFGTYPSQWKLTGAAKARAEAEYNYDGEDLAYILLDIDHPLEGEVDPDAIKAHRLAKLKLDYRYHKISEYEYGLGLLENDVKLTELDRERQIAKYLNRFGKLTSEELEYKLLDLSYVTPNTESYQRERLKLDVQFGKKTPEEADLALLDLRLPDKTTTEYQIALLELQHRWGKIDVNAMEKGIATLNKEPWFNVIGADNKIKGDNVRLSVELDWNSYFIDFLEGNGWTGVSADDIVDRWFDDAMRQMLNIDVGDEINDGSDNPMPMASNATTRKIRGEDGISEYR